jgi:hypothetical protein
MKNIKFIEDLPMIIPGQFGFNCPSGSNVNLCIAVVAILDFQSATRCIFFVPIGNPRWPPPQDID